MNRRTWHTAGLLLGLLFAFSTAVAAPPDQAPPPVPGAVAGLPPDKALALGERMYREGILPNGAALKVVSSGTTPAPGMAFTCVSCHLRSGVGSVEGGVITLPTNGAKLAQTRYWKFPNLSPEERKSLRVQTPVAREPYTDQTLAHALRTGVDPSGRVLSLAMPRYDLQDQDMAILVQYLWSLSAKPSPGVEEGLLRFATIVTDEVSPEDEQAMLVPMNNYVARHNTHVNGMGSRMYMSIGGKEMGGAYRQLALSVWRLKGAPETWGRQLEAYLAKEPVFALLGGLTYGEWQPIHAFCESHRLPCLFPITELPVVSSTDWYTEYFSKGYYQEGQAVARYLESLGDPASARRILQIVQDGPEGRDLATGFREAWQDLGQLGTAKELRLKQGETLNAAALRALLEQEQPTTVLLWTGASSFAALAGLADQPGRPARVFLSSRLLGAKAYGLPEAARAFTWFTYPYREPQDEPKISKYANALLKGLAKHKPETRISTRTYAMLRVFQLALVEVDRNFYRDNLLDRLGLLPDQALPDYFRLTFGTGQRYAAKGCYIMQLSPGPEPKFIRKSEWVIH